MIKMESNLVHEAQEKHNVSFLRQEDKFSMHDNVDPEKEKLLTGIKILK